MASSKKKRVLVAAARRPEELVAADLKWVCRPGDHNLGTVEKDQPFIGIIGQERAIRALKLGIELYGPGYNVFVCGIAGTGRATTVQKILDKIKGVCPLPPDRCYVHNFTKPDEPRLLTLPRGSAEDLRTGMERFVKEIQTDLASLLESEPHLKKRERIVAKYEGEGDRIIERFEKHAEKEGFALKRVRDGGISRPELFPMIQGQAMSIMDLEKAVSEGKVPEKKASTIRRQYQSLRQHLESAARASRDLLSRMEAEISDLEKKEARQALESRAAALVATHPADTDGVIKGYMAEVVEEAITHLDLFRRSNISTPATSPSSAAGGGDGATGLEDSTQTGRGLRELLDRFRVNVIFDSRREGQCPVVVEGHPAYRRLFGYFEKSLDQSGHWTTDYTRIRPGSLLAADGGYLIVTAEDLFSQPEVWRELKRSLISRTLSIMEESAGVYFPTISLRPQPIPLNVKVIMIGQRAIYEELLENEPDFRKMFKVIADFDDEMDLSTKTIRQYAAFIRRTCVEEGLADLEPSAVAAVAEFGARQAGHQGKLSTRFGDIADLLREADYWRKQDGAGRKVLTRHVRAAVDEARHRRDLTEEKLREMVRLDQVLLDVKGTRIGQINGLTIQNTGSHVFGLPARITATVSPGTAGIINIEREALLSGKHHTKGVLIIGGFLREKFGTNRPVTLTASIAFEQSYFGVDGDSASSTEVYALLSALSGLPLKQGIAVTGSVDQKGDVQPVGGINDKIEGYYKVCLVKGLAADQGVIVPRANLGDLMLDEQVIEAVRKR
ncbi:MAG TPA: ATP-binding protein, partial [Candidatus Polarisedimenticolia bacterium]|nr:ATP-binding protein [Candidatus Polarisedimenticolia bacterium]